MTIRRNNGRNLRQLLKIPYDRLDDINAVLLNPDMQVVNNFLEVVRKYGTPEEINRKAPKPRQLPNLLEKVGADTARNICKDLQWLERAARPQALHQRRGLPPQGAGRRGRHDALRR